MSSTKLRFRDYQLDPDGFELTRAGHRLRLERKPMELLILLAENQGHLLKREEIVEKIWGKDFFFDAENGINNAIRKIRSALNDSAEQPFFVETSLGKGYRFIAPVERISEPNVSPPPGLSVPLQKPALFRSWHAWAPVLGLTALLAAAFAFNFAGIRNRIFATGGPPIHSIAILPLENLSGDPNQEYLADGMTDALITGLAQVSSLRVISRTSAMHYKGSRQPLPEIANELKVDAVIEGSVTRSGNHLRITAQLLEARSDRHLWAKTYDRDMREIVALQQEVADSIVMEIQHKLDPPGGTYTSSKAQVNPEAYDDYLQGLYFWHKFNGPGTRKAAEYFEESIRKDPTFALGYAGLSHAYNELAYYERPSEVMPKSKVAAEQALKLDDTLAEAHAALGWVHWIYDWDWLGAEKEFKRAIQLNPGHELSHRMYAMYLDSAGRFDEAFREFQIARQLDPVSLGLIRNTGEHFRYLRQYDRAIAENRKVLEMDPGFEDALESLSHAYANKGMYEESIKVIEQLSIREGEQSLATTMKTAYARGGYKGALINRLQFYKDRRKAGSFVAFWDEALLQVQMGNQDLALAALEKACDEREDLTNLNVDPFWDNLRSDPRFQDLIRRIGIPVNGPGVAAQ
ncbi:MAG TPA: winged helix-turn-helix domain-containing protein [Candidatus Limnocylindrales bacterium]|nr:winged helix-turn-helix domain-containing protein [Candidatus Limnocylindrales bacterium]